MDGPRGPVELERMLQDSCEEASKRARRGRATNKLRRSSRGVGPQHRVATGLLRPEKVQRVLARLGRSRQQLQQKVVIEKRKQCGPEQSAEGRARASRLDEGEGRSSSIPACRLGTSAASPGELVAG